ncbi:MAG: CocE/NonD family hydrolase [Solirubrobacteraceae bacterium]|nr:CocE/NonD family hydrolase [Solirubrobacteraceae bacterium]
MPMRRALIAVLASVAALTCLPAAGAQARDAVVTSFDGTPIVVHFYGPLAAPPGGRAPTVVVGSTYPSPGDTRPDADGSDRIGLATLRRAGYNVLTFDPRGLGGSGGSVMFDSPAFEGRDMRSIVDFVAAQPEALLDAPGDPRIGMSGTSYGAGIQYLAAALDQRIDAIVPDMGWHSLVTALARDGAVKTGWLAPLCGLDGVAGAVDGKAGIGDVRPPTTGPALKTACVEGVAGSLSPASRTWLADHGPGGLIKQIRAPTLITQGTSDTLFSLDEAAANFAALRSNGVPAKMIWYCGGHVACPTNAGDPRHLARAGLTWLNRWLRADSSVDTGPAFEWQADDTRWRAGPDFPLATAGTLDAVGSGSLTIAARDTPQRGLARTSVPASNAVEARFPAPRGGADVLGAPRVRLHYRGRATPARTHLYAQVLDADAKRVAGGQATPIPVTLDGRLRTVERSLESVALRGGRSSSYRLQISPGAATYELQRSRGRVSVYGAFGSLPLVDARRSGHGARARTPPRPPIGVSMRRAGSGVRLALSARMSSRPCAGTVTFVVRTSRRPHVRNATLRTDPCRAATALHVPAGRDTLVRVSATFNGNRDLGPRAGRVVTRRVR